MTATAAEENSNDDAPAAPARSSGGRRGKRPKRPENRLVIRALQAVCVLFARVYHQTIVRAPLRLPTDGPAILVCNHISGLDPLLIQSVCPRVIIWMMAKEFYDLKALNWIFRLIEAIPVARAGRDMAATRAALEKLKEGRVLGVFPEGRIERTRELLPFQPGVALMAIKTGVPVYPAYLDGTQRNKSIGRAFSERNRAELRFGRAVEFDRSSTSRENLEDATEKIRKAVASLRDASL